MSERAGAGKVSERGGAEGAEGRRAKERFVVLWSYPRPPRLCGRRVESNAMTRTLTPAPLPLMWERGVYGASL